MSCNQADKVAMLAEMIREHDPDLDKVGQRLQKTLDRLKKKRVRDDRKD